VSRYQLRTKYQRIFRNVYAPQDVTVTASTKAVAAWLWSRRQATVAGMSAAALHGTKWINARTPAELNRASRDRPAGDIVLYSDALRDDEVCTVRGIPVTTPARTAFDIGRRRTFTAAVIWLDALMRATNLTAGDVELLVDRHRGGRGVGQLRRALALSDPGAESPQETRTRLILVMAGLPRPKTQIEVFDDRGFLARLDMGYEEWQLGVEFDGAHHWTDSSQRAGDIDRQAELEALGWRIIRVSSDMLRYRRETIVARTRSALLAAGWRPERRLIA
ncbi:MAG: DUF559 domain-containing protein, partial [Mycobacteriaceae bacterium]|nr:DUF559 domain-containing protein [Mycobacteriaceae bacterium]